MLVTSEPAPSAAASPPPYDAPATAAAVAAATVAPTEAAMEAATRAVTARAPPEGPFPWLVAAVKGTGAWGKGWGVDAATRGDGVRGGGEEERGEGGEAEGSGDAVGRGMAVGPTVGLEVVLLTVDSSRSRCGVCAVTMQA